MFRRCAANSGWIFPRSIGIRGLGFFAILFSVKPKLVGWLNIVFGLFGALQQGVLLFVTYPRLISMYQDFGADLPLSITLAPLFMGFMLLLSLGVTFIGIRLVFCPQSGQKLYKMGLVSLAILLILGGFHLAVSIPALIMPMYRITGNP